MKKEKRAALRKLAEEATPGPWWSGECRPPDGYALAWLGQSFVDCDGGRKNYVASSRDADYIAAANPQAIISMLDYIETLEEIEENLCELHNIALAEAEKKMCEFSKKYFDEDGEPKQKSLCIEKRLIAAQDQTAALCANVCERNTDLLSCAEAIRNGEWRECQ